MNNLWLKGFGSFLGFLLLCGQFVCAASSQIVLDDGRVVTGAIHPMRSVAETPLDKSREKNVQSEKIVVIDDQLRRIYLPKGKIRDILPDELTASYELFRLPQRVDRNPAHQVVMLGAYRSSVPFDNFGRRTLLVGGSSIVQGITEIAPNYVRVQGLNFFIDMRVSPHSIARKTLSALIRKSVRSETLDDRLRVYQFYVQAELYEQATEELEEIIKDFEGKDANAERLEVGLRMLRQLAADRLLDELELRRRAGQHQKVRALLESFESNGIAAEKQQAIRRLLSKDDDDKKVREEILRFLKSQADILTNKESRQEVEPLLREITKELNANTMGRFSEYQLSLKDTTLNDEARLAIGLSCWLTGNSGADPRLELALSLYRVRQLVRKYLLEKIPDRRESLWKQLQGEEATSPERIARLLSLMKPPQSTKRSDRKTFAYYELTVPSYVQDKTIRYYVQLPPEYDPNRSYPAIVTLHGERTTAPMQIDWWCGPWVERTNSKGNTVNERYGQATRYGYIVIAPEWGAPGRAYDYSAESHAAVLYSMRDALRRFSIDTDRLFLSGHSSGGDAVWDIGLAHPDLWAGIIPICGAAVKYPAIVKKNAQYVPVYAVGGELDGGKLLASREVLDWGMDLSKPFDMTYVQYKGRGNEPFSDELLRIFEWMQLRTRQFLSPEEKTVFSVRPWDNFFWSAELSHFPPEMLVDPTFWFSGESGLQRPAKTEFFRVVGNSVKVKSNAAWARICLSPELVDFQQRVEVLFNMKKISPSNGLLQPNARTLLDDVRTRGDRRHPFWVVLESEIGKK